MQLTIGNRWTVDREVANIESGIANRGIVDRGPWIVNHLSRIVIRMHGIVDRESWNR